MPDSIQQWCWRKIRFTLPATWEMLQFGKDPDEGYCGFADPHHFRFFLSWRKTRKAPDLERDAKHFTRGDGGPPEDLHIEGPGDHGWYGWRGRYGSRHIQQYARWFPDEGLTLTAVFSHTTPPPEKERPETILPTITIPEPTPGVPQRWEVAGLRTWIPAEVPLHQALFQPGKTELTFRRNPRKEPVWTMGRYERIEEWLTGGDLDRWLKKQLPPGFRADAFRRAEVRDHPYVGLVASARPRWFPLRHHPRRFFEIIAWICPQDQALYAASRQLLKADTHWEDPAAIPLSCCPDGPQPAFD